MTLMHSCVQYVCRVWKVQKPTKLACCDVSTENLMIGIARYEPPGIR